MPSLKKKRSTKKLEATVEELEARAERAETKAARWKKRAKKAEAEATGLEARAAELDKKLVKVQDVAQGQVPAPDASQDDQQGDQQDDRSSATPDADWTVAQLRAEARSRGLTGMSNKSKAELLEALR